MPGKSLFFSFLFILLFLIGSDLSGQSYFATINSLGSTKICRGDSVGARIWFWGGEAPYTIVINDKEGKYLVLENYDDLETFYLHPEDDNIFTIGSVVDNKGRRGGSNGSVSATVYQPTPVTIVADRKAFLETDPGFELKASPKGGTFTGKGISGSTFYPAVATSNGSPHRITCIYENENGCTSLDRESLYVLSGESSVQLLSGNDIIETVCDDGAIYTLRGSNEDHLSGSFKLFRVGSSSAIEGHITDSDPSDNEASITFEGLAGAYKVVYTYGMESIEIEAFTEFLVYEVDLLGIQDLPDTVCKNDLPFPLVPEVGSEDPFATYAFSGPGVTGSTVDGFFFDPGTPEVIPGNNIISVNYTSSNACGFNLDVQIYAASIPALSFEPELVCLEQEGSVVPIKNLTDQKESVKSWSWEFGDPASGAQNLSELENPEHFYSEPGPRTIVLTATTFEGCLAQHTLNTLLADQPLVNFTWETDCYTDNQEIPFLATAHSEFSDLDTLLWTISSSGGSVLEVLERNPSDLSLDYSFPSLDSYELTFYAESEAGCQGEVSRRIDLIPVQVLSDVDYMETFDAIPATWIVESEDQLKSWVLGTPDFAGFEPSENDKAWYTSLPSQPGDYLEHSWVRSPCFDFSAMSNPVIQMDLMKSFMPGRDGAVLQYQDQISQGWLTLGSIGSGLNWYNDSMILNMPGGEGLGWGLTPFEPDTRWLRARHPLGMLAGKPHVKFRFALATGSSQEITAGKINQGFAFNNFFIGEANLRRSVLEYFTNSSDENMFAADHMVNNFASEHTGLVYDLHYHMDYPQEDPMNANNPLPPSTRAFNYGVPDVPYAVLNGGPSSAHRFNLSPPAGEISEEVLIGSSLETPVFELFLSVNYREDSLKGKATIVCLDQNYNSYLQLYVVVIEKKVSSYYWLNQDSSFRNVVLDILPTAAGKLLGNSWSSESTIEIEFAWEYASYLEDMEDLSVVAFVQDRESGSILQAAAEPHTFAVAVPQDRIVSPGMFIYPNPADDQCRINFGSRTEKDGHVLLIDISGREVMQTRVAQGTQIQELVLTQLPEGLFLVLWREAGILKGEAKLILQR